MLKIRDRSNLKGAYAFKGLHSTVEDMAEWRQKHVAVAGHMEGTREAESVAEAGGSAVTFKVLYLVTYFCQAGSAGKGHTLPNQHHKHLEHMPTGILRVQRITAS